jgi:hypothetical protein
MMPKIANVQSVLKSNMFLVQYLIGSSPAAHPYLQDCATKYAELAKMSNEVEIGLYTCVWLSSRS